MNNNFEWLWQYNQGELFLKEENSSLEWKKSLAEYFYNHGYDHGSPRVFEIDTLNFIIETQKIIINHLDKKLEIAVEALEAIANEVEIDTDTYRQYIDMIVGNRIKAKEALAKIKEIENASY